MRWLALSVEADVEAVEAVSEILGRMGRGSAIEPLRLVEDETDEQALHPDPAAGYRVTAWVPEDGDAPGAVERIQKALWHLRAFDLRPMTELQVATVDDVDWATAWRDGYEVQRIGRLRIVPSWLETPDDGGVVVRLDPGMAFGTGIHPTTRGCLDMLQRVDPMPAAALDVGCGSGILALSALALGAERAVGCDTDTAAVEASRANAEHNGLADRFVVRHASLTDDASERFSLVLANLVAAVLIELAPRLAAHTAPRGTLIASGIIDSRLDEVTSVLAVAGFTEVDRIVAGEWVTLRCVRAA
jgi:ribosomal protein L11 methyltransferase